MTYHHQSSSAGCGCGRKPCNCGCDECKTACRLDCPTRPIFHRGQLLSDTHLNALTGWVSDRLRLQRFRDGWGVACGLEVRPDSAVPSRLRIHPGYAVGCCGDDLVLCEETCLDLAKVCAAHPSGCADPRGKNPDRPETTHIVDIVLDSSNEAGCHVPPKGCDDKNTDRGVAVPTVVRETARPGWRWAKDDPDPTDRFVRDWSSCVDIVKEVFDATDVEQRQKLLLNATPELLLWLYDEVRRAELDQFKDDSWLATILFWCVVDCRLALLDCACRVCDVDDRVRLARVWLRPTSNAAGRSVCRIVHIETTPPYRSLLHRDCPPVRIGFLDAARSVYWRSPDDARAALASGGFAPAPTDKTVQPPKTVEELLALTALDPWIIPAPARQRIQMQVVQLPLEGLGLRVVNWTMK